MTGSRAAGTGFASLAVVVALALAAGAFDLFDYDLGLARATGRWILEHRAVPETNVFSDINAAHPFVDDKWLFHVLAYVVIDGLGAAPAVLLRMALLALTFAMLLPRRGDGGATAAEHSAAALLAVVAIVTAHERFAFRPELLTLLFLAGLWRRLRSASPLTGRDVALLLVMQVLWTNVHGYFVLGPIVAGASAAGAWLDRRCFGETRPDIAVRVALAPMMIAVGLINPYGVDLLLSPLTMLRGLEGGTGAWMATIVEFAPPFSYFPRLSTDLVAYRVLLVLTAVGALVKLRGHRFHEWMPLLALFAMSLELRRNMAPFAIVAAPVAAAWLGAGLARFHPFTARALLAISAASALVLGFLFATDRIAVLDRLDRTAGFGFSAVAHPDAEIEFVLEHLPPDGLFNSFTFGSTFTGRAFPGRKPFIDGNTAGYSPEFLASYMDYVTGEATVDDLLSRYAIKSFLIRPGHALTAALLGAERFVPLFLGRHAVVIAVADRVDPEVVKRFDLRPGLRDGTFEPIASTQPSTLSRATFPVAELNQARLELAMQLPARAEASLERALAIAPEAYEIWQMLGVARFRREAHALAREAFDRSIELAPGAAETFVLRAMLLIATRRLPEAEADVETARSLRGDDSEIEGLAARLALERGDRQGALAHLRRALELEKGASSRKKLEDAIDRLR